MSLSKKLQSFHVNALKLHVLSVFKTLECASDALDILEEGSPALTVLACAPWWLLHHRQREAAKKG